MTKLNIIVCIKQVPDVDDIKWTKENNLDRTLMLSKLNPYDEIALNNALDIKKRHKNASIIVISMGPNQAEEIIKYALAKGCDEGMLLSDKLFAASDTLITAEILKTAIQKYLKNYNLILTGQMAVDGDTQQVPLMLSQMLNINSITNLVSVKEIKENSIEVVQKVSDKLNIIESNYPALLAFKQDNTNIENPKIDNYIFAQEHKILKYSADDLGLTKEQTGLTASPTMVYKTWRPQSIKNTVEINENYSKTIYEFIDEAVK